MLKQKLEGYVSRKELSQKAKSEVMEIISMYADDISKLSELVASLYQLPIDIIYNFIKNNFRNFDEAFKNSFIEYFIEFFTANKAAYAFIVCEALSDNCSNIGIAVLEKIVLRCFFEKKINKQFYVGLNRASKYDGFPVLFSKFDGWSPQSINAYAVFLTDFYLYIGNSSFLPNIVNWYNTNNVEMPKLIADEVNRQGNKDSKEDVELIKPIYSTTELLFMLQEKLSLDKEKYSKVISKNNVLLTENKSFLSTISGLERQISALMAENEQLIDKKKEMDVIIAEIKEQKEVLSTEISNLTKEKQILSERLSNVESAYSHAGNQELEAMRQKIKSRLYSTYCKYVDIKGKEIDIDYYDILLIALDEVFKTLRKAGIDF